MTTTKKALCVLGTLPLFIMLGAMIYDAGIKGTLLVFGGVCVGVGGCVCLAKLLEDL